MTRPGDSGRQRSILPAALLAQTAVVALAVLMAWLAGLRPWRQSVFSLRAVSLAVAATVPLAGIFLLVPADKYWRWAREMQAVATRRAALLFAGRVPGAIVAVSVLTGGGVERLVRTVIQTALGQQNAPAIRRIGAHARG